MSKTKRFALLAFYLFCIIGAYVLVPGPLTVLLVAYTVVVWFGGVSFLRLVQEWNEPLHEEET